MDSEKWSSFIVLLLIAYVTGKYVSFSHTEYNAVHFATSGLLFLESFALLWLIAWRHYSLQDNQQIYRPHTSSGIFMILLVPVALLGNVSLSQEFEAHYYKIQEIFLSLTSAFSVILWFCLKDAQVKRIFTVGIILGTVVVFQWFSVLYIFTFIIQWKGITLIPSLLPKTFTLGEISVVLQLANIWVFRIILACFQKLYLTDEVFEIFWFHFIFVTAICMATIFVFLSKSYLSLTRFIAVYVITAVCALLLLFVVLRENPILWILQYIFGCCEQIFLISSWFTLFTITIIWTVIQSLTKASLSSEKYATRKVFHVFILLVYIPGLVLHTHLLLIASIVTFGLFVIIETTRALQVPVIGKQLHEILSAFVDERDQGPIFLTHIYLLTGLSLSLWLSPNLFTSVKASNEMYSGVLSLGIGDSVACVIGSKFGRIHYPGSRKTVEGTIASIATQMFAVIFANNLGIIQVSSMSTVFIGVSLSSLFEAFTDQIDNLMLPLVLYPILCYS
ncbi:hypothetical protein Btru_055222 [Bulinus truncatus]|nr:hypothetical protein Btru_055222 [Bulinus truncatus]